MQQKNCVFQNTYIVVSFFPPIKKLPDHNKNRLFSKKPDLRQMSRQHLGSTFWHFSAIGPALAGWTQPFLSETTENWRA